jgi:hypothetical protein
MLARSSRWQGVKRAEIRIANEIDAAQSRGEVAKTRVANNRNEATLDEPGLDRRRVAEWRELRMADESAAA